MRGQFVFLFIWGSDSFSCKQRPTLLRDPFMRKWKPWKDFYPQTSLVAPEGAPPIPDVGPAPALLIKVLIPLHGRSLRGTLERAVMGSTSASGAWKSSVLRSAADHGDSLSDFWPGGDAAGHTPSWIMC